MCVQADMVISGAFRFSMATAAIENNLKNLVFSSLQKILSVAFLLVLYKACNEQILSHDTNLMTF